MITHNLLPTTTRTQFGFVDSRGINQIHILLTFISIYFLFTKSDCLFYKYLNIWGIVRIKLKSILASRTTSSKSFKNYSPIHPTTTYSFMNSSKPTTQMIFLLIFAILEFSSSVIKHMTASSLSKTLNILHSGFK